MSEQPTPTRLDAELGLTTTRIGQPLWHYHSVPSTMPLAHAAARAGASDGTTLLADEQTAGRGRLGRRWLAPSGKAILCSTICRPLLPPDQLFLLLATFSLGLCAGITSATGLTPQIKWPNDLLLDGQKFAGLLCESQITTRGLNYAVVGFGINLNLTTTELPPRDAASLPATSLAIASGTTYDRNTVLLNLLNALDQAYSRLWAGETAAIQAEWSAHLAGRGELVQVTTSAGQHRGRFVGVAADGALLLATTNGTERFLVGDLLLGPRTVAEI